MHQNLLILPDGTRILSGPGADPAIQKVTLTQTVNPETELTFGGVCSQMLEVTLWASHPIHNLKAGDRVLLYEKEQEERLVGQFLLEELQRTGNICKLTAYDPISQLDRDLTDYIGSLQNWPYTLLELTKGVLSACGLELAGEEIPNAQLPVQKFTARSVTGRQLIAWAAQVSGCFCRATAEGKAEFAWYTPSALNLGPDGDAFYYGNSLRFSDYAVKPVTGVQIRWEAQDVGTVWPQEGSGDNPYIIEGNPFLMALEAHTLLPVAQTLFQRLQGVSYTPCQLTVPSSLQISPGQIVTVLAGDTPLTVYVMERKRTAGRDTLICTGSRDRGSMRARNQAGYKALSGKVLRLQTDVDGIRAENADTAGNFARMELDLQGIRTQVQSYREGESSIKQQLSQLEMDSQGLRLQLQSVLDDGVSKVVTATGYRFGEEGLSVQKDGQEMENLLDHTGMYVRRSGEVILQANNQGVVARDVTAANYLIMGENARFEDYSNGADHNRTACFYIS